MSKHVKLASVLRFVGVAVAILMLAGCAAPAGAPSPATAAPKSTQKPTTVMDQPTPTPTDLPDIMKKCLVAEIFTADPSAHVFGDMLYIYPSHDLDHDNPSDMYGGQYDMEDYHVFSMADMHTLPVDHGEALNVRDVPWAVKQMWAPDAAYKDGTYYFYFPAKDREDIFRIGVATSPSPTGPFTPQAEPIPGSFSIDPAVFVDDDGQAYMYFGGLSGGQLERWQTGAYDPNGAQPANDQPALGPRVVKLSADMLHFDGTPQELVILDESGAPLRSGDHERRFFEASWMHKYNGTYYFSYSTGESHYIAYATSENPLGPFTFRGYILSEVQGWTTHHSIVKFQGKWYLFYHDASLSGVDHKRCMKVTELNYNDDGTIKMIDPYGKGLGD